MHASTITVLFAEQLASNKGLQRTLQQREHSTRREPLPVLRPSKKSSGGRLSLCVEIDDPLCSVLEDGIVGKRELANRAVAHTRSHPPTTSRAVAQDQPAGRRRASPSSSRRGTSGGSVSLRACWWPWADILPHVLARMSASLSD